MNLKSFMREENYTNEEIEAKFEEVKECNHNMMDKIIKRLKLNSEDSILPKVFDHWTKWIKVKRLMKYHLRFCNNTVEYVKCDLRWAFERWKRGDLEMSAFLE